METTENEAVMKLGRITLEQYEGEARKEERLSQLKKALPADQWRRLLALAQAYDKACGAYHDLEELAEIDVIREAANLADHAACLLCEAGEEIYPYFHEDLENLQERADEEARLAWARALVEYEASEDVMECSFTVHPEHGVVAMSGNIEAVG